jgi:hypothetical protein
MKPWSDMKTPEGKYGYTATLADPEHPFDFYWGRNFNGQYVFRFMGDFPPDICDEAPVMSGIYTVAGVEAGRSHITLALESGEDASIFYYLCMSLMEATKKISRESDLAAAGVVLTHLGRWQNLLKNRGSKLLSLNKQMGLFGELMVLKDIFLDNLEAREAVSCWTGPLGDEQDFGYGSSLVEVKTSRSTRDREINISSIAQLDTVSGRISLIFQTIGVFEDKPPSSISLNMIIAEIMERLSRESPNASEQFGMRLALLGYENHLEYDKHHFAPVSRKVFSVEDDFPRIEYSDVRKGVSKCSYTILVDNCLPFEIEADLAVSRILQDVESASLNSIEVPVETLVKLDESNELEFKSSLRYCYSHKIADKLLEQVVVKSISAFTNTLGGKLVIGVDDRKNVLGLENDYGTLRQLDRDGFELHLSSILINAFGEAFVAHYIKSEFHMINGNEICVVLVKRSEELRFVEVINKAGVKAKKLYARLGNSSREIPPERIPEYIESR